MYLVFDHSVRGRTTDNWCTELSCNDTRLHDLAAYFPIVSTAFDSVPRDVRAYQNWVGECKLGAMYITTCQPRT